MDQERNTGFLTAISLYIIIAATTTAAAENIIYVKQGATGNGTTWADAYGDLQDALNDAAAGDPNKIWVAAGTYYPTSDYGLGIGDRGKHFRMLNSVTIYGGFPPGGGTFANRDPNQYETILSGDILGYNCYHVFYHPAGTNLDSTAGLDGITITDGYADGSGDHCFGGGMYNYDSSPTVTNCKFIGNSAEWENGRGGGMYNDYYSSPTVTGCYFSGNTAYASTTGAGGGMFNNNNSNPTVFNCTFTGNSAFGKSSIGGGMSNRESSPTVTGCIFSDNLGTTGVGMHNYNSSPTVTGCTFGGNLTGGKGRNGAGMCNRESSNPIVTGCIFWDNDGSSEIYNYFRDVPGFPVFSHCDIAGCFSGGSWNNSFGIDGGGNIDADPNFVDAANGDFHLQNTSPCIDAGDNRAPSLSDTDFDGDPRIMNGIVDIGADEVAGDILFSLDITIEPFPRAAAVTLDPPGGVYLHGTEVTITIDAEEGFIFEQFSDSLTGNDNPVTITMDSHKYITAHLAYDGDVIYVDAGATGSNTGASWTHAFADLQDALAVADYPNQIWVAAGTYYPTSNHGFWWKSDRAKHFRMINDVAIYGGFAPGGGTFVNRDPNQYETILSGDIGVLDDNSDNCYHVFSHPDGTNLDVTAIIDGFTITAGNAASYGGGMYNYSSSPTVTNCIFTGNTANYDGGGMYNISSSPTVISCIFSDNYADDDGGGLYNYSSNPIVISCIFSSNSTGDYGGGMYNNSSSSPIVISCIFNGNSTGIHGGGMYNHSNSPTVTNCIFTGNTANYDGGGMLNSSSSPTVISCIFNGNSAGRYGGGMYNYSSSPTVTNSTFIGNSAINNGGGISIYKSNTSVHNNTFTNCTFVANSAPNGSGLACDSNNQDYPSTSQFTNCILWNGGDQIWNNDGSTITITYSDVQDDDPNDASIYPGTGNIDAYPLFVDPNGLDDIAGTEDDNYRLQAGSPCIDAGDNTAIPADAADLDNDANTVEPVPFDLNGFPRFIDDLCTVDTGNGAAPVVDMGAYEYLRADINSSGAVNEDDLAYLITFWLNTSCGTCGKADLTCDGNVKQPDFAAIAEHWQTGLE